MKKIDYQQFYYKLINNLELVKQEKWKICIETYRTYGSEKLSEFCARVLHLFKRELDEFF